MSDPGKILQELTPQNKQKKTTRPYNHQLGPEAKLAKKMILNGTVYKQGRWTKDEHFRFLEALKLYGKEWKKVQEHVRTRTST